MSDNTPPDPPMYNRRSTDRPGTLAPSRSVFDIIVANIKENILAYTGILFTAIASAIGTVHYVDKWLFDTSAQMEIHTRLISDSDEKIKTLQKNIADTSRRVDDLNSRITEGHRRLDEADQKAAIRMTIIETKMDFVSSRLERVPFPGEIAPLPVVHVPGGR